MKDAGTRKSPVEHHSLGPRDATSTAMLRLAARTHAASFCRGWVRTSSGAGKEEHVEGSGKDMTPGLERLARESVVQDLQSVGRQVNEASEDEEDEFEVPNPDTGELFGPKGPEPTRYGDWERGGRCSDF
eukprot:scaffold649_cov347-Pavlova_lutheri.AAC.76